ncbi:hypothetical protein [Lentibacter sp.]|uniref:hypothetical protein n=1 Tax=Lentibacter sp. TaxID=2024994 RepID=UPI003F6A410A
MAYIALWDQSDPAPVVDSATAHNTAVKSHAAALITLKTTSKSLHVAQAATHIQEV